ncbi:MAG: DUF3299 domain-containing protein [Phycisphaerales bacterium]|nr:DUF3299 domain-containing protein [Phycisphaerales bacterium]
MRILWIIIILTIIAGGGVMLMSGGSDDTPPKSPGAASAPVPVDVAPSSGEEKTADALAAELSADAEARVTPPENGEETTATTTAADIASTTITDGLDVEIAHAKVIPGKIQPGPDDTLLVDDEWTLRGDGTRDAPYEPSWEYLYSAADTYQPRLGENEIPQRIALLNDKWVRIAGFTAIPLLTGETTEMLVMLNQWDGCCIGVPPTPFDAIEVHLIDPVNRKSGHTSEYGSVMGRMKVDPYLIENWLVGLYILEESSCNMEP